MQLQYHQLLFFLLFSFFGLQKSFANSNLTMALELEMSKANLRQILPFVDLDHFIIHYTNRCNSLLSLGKNEKINKIIELIENSKPIILRYCNINLDAYKNIKNIKLKFLTPQDPDSLVFKVVKILDEKYSFYIDGSKLEFKVEDKKIYDDIKSFKTESNILLTFFGTYDSNRQPNFGIEFPVNNEKIKQIFVLLDLLKHLKQLELTESAQKYDFYSSLFYKPNDFLRIKERGSTIRLKSSGPDVWQWENRILFNTQIDPEVDEVVKIFYTDESATVLKSPDLILKYLNDELSAIIGRLFVDSDNKEYFIQIFEKNIIYTISLINNAPGFDSLKNKFIDDFFNQPTITGILNEIELKLRKKEIEIISFYMRPVNFWKFIFALKDIKNEETIDRYIKKYLEWKKFTFFENSQNKELFDNSSYKDLISGLIFFKKSLAHDEEFQKQYEWMVAAIKRLAPKNPDIDLEIKKLDDNCSSHVLPR